MRQIAGHIYDDGRARRLDGAETFTAEQGTGARVRVSDNNSGATVRNSQHGEGQRKTPSIDEPGGRRKEDVSVRDSAAGQTHKDGSRWWNGGILGNDKFMERRIASRNVLEREEFNFSTAAIDNSSVL